MFSLSVWAFRVYKSGFVEHAAASVYEQRIPFSYRYPTAPRRVLDASVHLLLTPDMTSMLVNVNRHVGNHVYTRTWL